MRSLVSTASWYWRITSVQSWKTKEQLNQLSARRGQLPVRHNRLRDRWAGLLNNCTRRTTRATRFKDASLRQRPTGPGQRVARIDAAVS